MKKVGNVVCMCLLGALSIGCFSGFIQNEAKKKDSPTMTFIGHASIKIRSSKGKVIYIDPYFPTDSYREPADYILMTHSHHDHTAYELCTQNNNCKIIRWSNALIDGEYQTFEEDGIKIEAVPSGGNQNHNINACVGFIVTVDGVRVFHAGDTSMNQLTNTIAGRNIDYAMYPIDGVYNMGPEEATEVANLIGATHNIPIHGYGDDYPRQTKEFHANGKLVMKIGETMILE